MADHAMSIVEKVTENPGIKPSDLALLVMADMGPQRFDGGIFFTCLEQIIKIGDIVEIELVSDYKTETKLFPSGKKILLYTTVIVTLDCARPRDTSYAEEMDHTIEELDRTEEE